MKRFRDTRWVADTYGSFKTLIRVEDERGNGRKIATTYVGDANPKRREGETKDAFYERSRLAHLNRARDSEAHAVLIALTPEMLNSLMAMADWTKAALNCKDWHWDGDQREAAELELATALEVIARADLDATVNLTLP